MLSERTISRSTDNDLFSDQRRAESTDSEIMSASRKTEVDLEY